MTQVLQQREPGGITPEMLDAFLGGWGDDKALQVAWLALVMEQVKDRANVLRLKDALDDWLTRNREAAK